MCVLVFVTAEHERRDGDDDDDDDDDDGGDSNVDEFLHKITVWISSVSSFTTCHVTSFNGRLLSARWTLMFTFTTNQRKFHQILLTDDLQVPLRSSLNHPLLHQDSELPL